MSRTGRIGGGRVCGEEGFCGRCSARGVQNGGGGRDRGCWCGSGGGMRNSRAGGVCAAQRRRVLEGCGGIVVGACARACERPVYLQGREPRGIQVTQLFAYLACACSRQVPAGYCWVSDGLAVDKEFVVTAVRARGRGVAVALVLQASSKQGRFRAPLAHAAGTARASHVTGTWHRVMRASSSSMKETIEVGNYIYIVIC